jgi:hypothetical protein
MVSWLGAGSGPLKPACAGVTGGTHEGEREMDAIDHGRAYEAAKDAEKDRADRLSDAYDVALERVDRHTPEAARWHYLDALEEAYEAICLHPCCPTVVRVCALLDSDICRLAPDATCEEWLSGDPVETGIPGISIVGLDFDGCDSQISASNAVELCRINIDLDEASPAGICELADRTVSP